MNKTCLICLTSYLRTFCILFLQHQEMSLQPLSSHHQSPANRPPLPQIPQALRLQAMAGGGRSCT